jgi:hypothetical protein
LTDIETKTTDERGKGKEKEIVDQEEKGKEEENFPENENDGKFARWKYDCWA